MKSRLSLWEAGDMGSLALRVQGQTVQQIEESRRAVSGQDGDARLGKQACTKARKKAFRKAVMGFVGSPAEGSVQDKLSWSSLLIPRARNPGTAIASDA
eukprot:5282922-Karenia_brevis.AAC.1